MQKVTLGGDRLGSGKKMKVSLHGFERSTHDMGYIWRSTMAPGTLVPFMGEIGLPGDTFDIGLDCDIKTHPTIGPLFGSYKVQLDVFVAPVRLYQGQLHNNKLGIGMNMAAVKLPIMQLTCSPVSATTKDIDNAQINPSSILSYIGIRGVGITQTGESPLKRDFHALKLLSYWDIYKNYYANQQEERGAVIHTETDNIESVTSANIVYGVTSAPLPEAPAIGFAVASTGSKITFEYTGPHGTNAPNPDHIILVDEDGNEFSFSELCPNITDDSDLPSLIGIYNYFKYGHKIFVSWHYLAIDEVTVQEPKVRFFPLENIDSMREYIMSVTTDPNPFIVNDYPLEPYSLILGASGGRNHMMNTQEGLGLKTYQSDMLNNWLNTEWIDGTNGISEVTAIDTSGGSFTLDTLNLSKKVYDMLNRIAVSGGTYKDWLDTQYDHKGFTQFETPMYVGGLSRELVFQEVVSNAEAGGGAEGDGAKPLGTLAGKGVMGSRRKGGHVRVKCNEICVIMGIISLTPRLDYSQGNKWDVGLLTMDDFHKPALDEIGFQESINEQRAWWSTQRPDTVPTDWVLTSAGKVPAWLNYMTNVNETRGNFAIGGLGTVGEMFMTLNRKYEYDTTLEQIKDLTTYIDPVKFNSIFAETARDAQNFWAQVAVDITARRKMSAKIMPVV